jgi:NADH-quinone oxidoreductase subunit E
MSATHVRPITTTEGTRPFAFSEAALAECRALMARYPEGRSKSALIPILHIAQSGERRLAQRERHGCRGAGAGLQHIEVYEVASFYSMFNLHPVGTYVLDVCRTTPCMLRGSDDLIAHLEKKLGMHCG